MKSPEDMRIIQIDITNACIHQCSNCTRFCGHHKKPFFMDFDTFKKAVDSFKGYNGTVGVMGGEPTLHPEFERFLDYLQDHQYYSKKENMLNRPTDRFINVIAKMEQNNTFINHEHGIDRRCVQGYGLWTALSNNYIKHYEKIQDVFNFQCVNDHTNIMYHSPIFIRRKDLGISDSEWIDIRDNCWAQREWSATITPKGAFFCEIAAALDMLFDGPGGWPIEPGWWKRKPEEFGEQLQWCELCGIAMSSFTRNANDEIDDMSFWYYEKLKEIKSPKLERNLFNVLDINENGVISDKSKEDTKAKREHQYIDGYFARFNKDNNWLNPTGIIGLMIACEDELVNDYLSVVEKSSTILDKVIVVTNKKIKSKLDNSVVNKANVTVLLEESNKFGAKIQKAIRNMEPERNPFLVLLGAESILATECKKFLKRFVLNPGSILIGNEKNYMRENVGEKIEVIFSPNAKALKRATEPTVSNINNISEFIALWEDDKQIEIIDDNFEYHDYIVEKDIKYAIYGCGLTAEQMLCQFDNSQIVAVSDSDEGKWGKKFAGHSILSPKELVDNASSYDKIFIASKFYFEIKDTLLGLGVPIEKIVTSINAM